MKDFDTVILIALNYMSINKSRMKYLCYHVVVCINMSYLCIFFCLYDSDHRYMRRRCWFLDNLPAYNYNTGVGIKRESGEITDTKHLGSTLIAAMIKEAEQFCHPSSEASRDYHQVHT